LSSNLTKTELILLLTIKITVFLLRKFWPSHFSFNYYL